MRARSDRLVLISTAARALAASAVRGGSRPIVLDCFGDRETRANAHRYVPLRVAERGIDAAALRADLAVLRDAHGPGVVVYGSGFEGQPELLDGVRASGYRIAGNDPEVVRAVKDPAVFLPVLDALKIPHPEVSFEPRRAAEGWLVKNARADGGAHVHRARGQEMLAPGWMFQREVTGQAMSALFVADGRCARVIGFNTLWTDADDPCSPFRYGGAINHTALPRRQRTAVAAYVEGLVRAFSLKGINGLDFIASESGCQVLEINPRPCATLELYEPDVQTGLVALHVRACAERLPPGLSLGPRRVRACRVVYARRDLHIDAGRRWPRWCRDLPQPASHIRAGEPVCTVHASGEQAGTVTATVNARWTALAASLGECPAGDTPLYGAVQ